MHFDVKPASDYPLPDLIELFNHGFENYFIPLRFNSKFVIFLFYTLLKSEI
jgi:hypothetical protein